ncbi:PAS domain S-box protein [Mongoliibacter ruber]|uniref:histidine kinase n=1 Tax=Mongoliibacter ruber TaxID=1750599 RepID=A0A2T0WMU3_9BACT|nr:PAS domain S-box protein [Mongoliibacter ruber]PRY88021.1 PAS domain S-box-containing protein [Mongoliibacter ruber]
MEKNSDITEQSLRENFLRSIDLLSEKKDKDFTEILNIAAALSQCGTAYISVICGESSVLKASLGTKIQKIPVEHSICTLAVQAKEFFYEAESIRQNKKFSKNALLQENPSLNYCCCIPIPSNKGINLGAISLLFKENPKFNDQTKNALILLAQQLGNTLNLRHDIVKKKAKNAILTSGLKFRNSILTSIPDLIFIQDKEGNYLEVLGGNEDDLMLNPSEFLGRNIIEIQNEARVMYFFDAIEKIANGIEPQPLHYTLETQKGLQEYEIRISLFGNDKVISLVRNITQKAIAERELRKTRELLEISSSLAQIGAWGFNLIDKTIEWSKTTKAIHELEEDFTPTIEDAFSLYFTKNSQEKINELLQYAISSGRPFDDEFEINTAKGNKKWVRVLGQAEYENNTCMRIYGTFQDITEKKEAQLSKEASDMEYKKLFDVMAQGIVYQAKEGHIIKANNAASKILGLSMDEIVGRTSMDPRWRAILEDGSPFPGELHPAMVALKTGKPVKNQIMGVFHPGKNIPKWIIIDSEPEFRNNEKKPFRVLNSFTDITELKKTRLKIEESQANLKAIIDSSSEGIWAVDKKLSLNFSNKVSKEQIRMMYGSKLNDGKNIIDLLPEIQKAVWQKRYDQALQGKSIKFTEMSAEKNYNFDITMNPIKMREKVLGVAVFANDMMEIRKYINTIEDQNKALKEIGFIQSHIVRAPVARIMGLVMLLEEPDFDEMNTLDILREIVNSCKELDLTIREISAKTYNSSRNMDI